MTNAYGSVARGGADAGCAAFAVDMRDKRRFELKAGITTALAIVALLIQITLVHGFVGRSALDSAPDSALSLICGHIDDGAAGGPDTPASDRHDHDCPCCLSANGHAVLPEPVAIRPPEPVFAVSVDGGRRQAQVADVATVADTQLPRAPPTLG